MIEARKRLADAGAAVPAVEAKARYAYIRKVTAAAVSKPTVRPKNTSDKLDRVLTHKVWGTLVFFAVMFLMFWSIFTAATPLMDLIDAGTGWFGKQVEGQMSAGPLRSLVVDGIITGVGGVVKFLPQILILFAFIAVLEDCGYMARAAFLMDRLMSRCGLSGKSFIPMLSSVACAVPGVMATRVIENHRDRLATILVAPLMSCSARIPVYVLMISLFLPDESAFAQALVMFAMYMIGFVAAPLWRGSAEDTAAGRAIVVRDGTAGIQAAIGSTVGLRVFDAGWQFLKRAGTVILASMIVIWAVQYFPNWNAEGRTYEGLVTTAEDARDEAKKQAAEAEGDDKERAEAEANAKTAEVNT